MARPRSGTWSPEWHRPPAGLYSGSRHFTCELDPRDSSPTVVVAVYSAYLEHLDEVATMTYEEKKALLAGARRGPAYLLWDLRYQADWVVSFERDAVRRNDKAAAKSLEEARLLFFGPKARGKPGRPPVNKNERLRKAAPVVLADVAYVRGFMDREWTKGRDGFAIQGVAEEAARFAPTSLGAALKVVKRVAARKHRGPRDLGCAILHLKWGPDLGLLESDVRAIVGRRWSRRP